MNLSRLSSPPATDTVVLTDYSSRPDDVMTFLCHAPGTVNDGERALTWRAPNGVTIVTIGFIDAHPWYPSHRTTVLLSDETGQPRSGDPQPGSAIGMVDHRGAAERWWQLTAPQRAKWQAALDVLEQMPVDADHQPQLPITPELEGVLRLTLPWIPRPVWPEWCRRGYAVRAGILIHGNGSPFRAQLGTAPPAGMLEQG